jgi:hypothetical protein
MLPCIAVLAVCVVSGAALTSGASARPEPGLIEHATAIRADVTARYRSPQGLVVTEASSTDVVGSLTLWTADGASVREVPTAHGVYYALCPMRATCPFPSRKRARPITAFAPRRAALELAIRTFAETTADPVVIALPTRRWVLLVLERSEVAGIAWAAALDAGDDPGVATTEPLRAVVDDLTLGHLYAPFALGTGSDGTDTLAAVQLTSSPPGGAGAR